MLFTWDFSKIKPIIFIEISKTDGIIFVKVGVFHVMDFTVEVEGAKVSGLARIDDGVSAKFDELDPVKRGESLFVLS